MGLWSRRPKPLVVNHEKAAQRARKLGTHDLVEAAYSTTGTVNSHIRSSDLGTAEEYAQILLVIIRELNYRSKTYE